MQLGRAIRDVVATRKDPHFAGIALLIVQPSAADGSNAGRALVAVDAIGAGVGEHVFFVRGKEASFPFHPVDVPADAGIVGIVDHWTADGVPVAAPGPVTAAPGDDRGLAGPRVHRRRRARDSGAGGRAGRVHREAPAVRGRQLLLVQPETPDGQPRGATLLAVDAVGAGRQRARDRGPQGRAAGEALGRRGAPWRRESSASSTPSTWRRSR